MATVTQPDSSGKPAPVRDHDTRRTRVKAPNPFDQRGHGFATSGPPVFKIGIPGIDFRARNLDPRSSVPSAEIQLGQCRIDTVQPASTCKPLASGAASPQWRRDHDSRQIMTTRKCLDAMCEPSCTTRIHREVSPTDATACRPDRGCMPPCVQDGKSRVHQLPHAPANTSHNTISASCSHAPSVSPVYPPSRRVRRLRIIPTSSVTPRMANTPTIRAA